MSVSACVCELPDSLGSLPPARLGGGWEEVGGLWIFFFLFLFSFFVYDVVSSCRLLYHLGECQNYLCIVLSCVVLLYQPTPASTGVDITPSGSTRSWSGLYYIADSKAARPVAAWLGERERERERDLPRDQSSRGCSAPFGMDVLLARGGGRE